MIFFDHVWTDFYTGHIIGVGLTVVQWAGGKNATPCPPSWIQWDFFNKTKVQRNFALLGLSLRHCWTTLFEETIPIWVHTSYKMVPFSLLGLVKPLQAAAAVAAVTDGWTGAELFLRTILTKLLNLSNKPKFWYRTGSEIYFLRTFIFLSSGGGEEGLLSQVLSHGGGSRNTFLKGTTQILWRFKSEGGQFASVKSATSFDLPKIMD